MKHNGSLFITTDNASAYRDVTEVTGWVELAQGATLDAPVLTKIAGHDLPSPEVAAKRLRDVAEAALLTPQALNMWEWHSCGSAHCIAGWAVHLEGADGYKLERETSSSTAGTILLGLEASKMFLTSNEVARDWLKSQLAPAAPDAA